MNKPTVPCPVCHAYVSLTPTGKLPKHHSRRENKLCERSLTRFSDADRTTSAAYCLERLRQYSHVRHYERALDELRSLLERTKLQVSGAELSLQQERERVAAFDKLTPEELFEKARYR